MTIVHTVIQNFMGGNFFNDKRFKFFYFFSLLPDKWNSESILLLFFILTDVALRYFVHIIN